MAFLAWSESNLPNFDLVGMNGCDDRGKGEGNDDEEEHQDGAGQGKFVTAETAPGAAPLRGCTALVGLESVGYFLESFGF